MKYIKKYENTYEEKHYWIVPTKEPEFSIALEKIGITNVEDWSKEFEKEKVSETMDKVYIFHVFDVDEYLQREYWDWTNLTYKLSDDDIFKGEIEVDVDEVKEYILKKDTNKYNL